MSQNKKNKNKVGFFLIYFKGQETDVFGYQQFHLISLNSLVRLMHNIQIYTFPQIRINM